MSSDRLANGGITSKSTWLLKTSRTPEQIRDLLKEHVGSDDQLLIVDISRDAAAWFGVNDAGSRWLEANLGVSLR